MRFLWFALLAGGTVQSATPLAPTRLHPRQVTTPAPAAPTGNFDTTKHITIPGITNDRFTVPPQTIDIVVPTCIATTVPDSNGHVPPGTCGAYWNYYPSFAAAAVLAAAFALLTVLHVWQAVRYSKRWCWVIIMSAVWETLALAFRAASTRDQQNTGLLLTFQIFVLLAPLWVNAFAYVTLGRMIYFFLPSRSLLHIPAPTIAAVFVALDVVSFAVQLAGGSMAGPTAAPDVQLRAIRVYMGGIGMQQLFIAAFVCLAVRFQRELAGTGRRAPGARDLLWALCFSLGMITVRITYRLVEFSSGSVDNELTRREWYFYALEAVPMVLAIAAFNLAHPGRVIAGPGSEMPGALAAMRAALAGRRGEKLLDGPDEEHELAGRTRPGPR